MTDTQLRALMEKSPDKWQKTLFEAYCGYVYAITANALKDCGTAEDIEECTADCFSAVFRRLNEENAFEGDLKGIIGSIARNKAIDTFRRLSARQKHTASIEEEQYLSFSSDENIIEDTERNITNEILMKCVEKLGRPDSDIIVQFYFYGRTTAQIAVSLRKSDSSIQKRLQRARKKLKKLLIDAGIETEG